MEKYYELRLQNATFLEVLAEYYANLLVQASHLYQVKLSVHSRQAIGGNWFSGR
jgi:hypothetical protein